jgi:tetratricopeptide (TPR) repeat protein
MFCRSLILAEISAGLVCAVLLAGIAAAQSTTDGMSTVGTMLNDSRIARAYNTAPGTGVLIFKVSSERDGHAIDRQALVKLVNLSTQNPIWRSTEDASSGMHLERDSQAVFTDLPYGKYDAEVSAVGYLSTHKELTVMATIVQEQIEIVLHRDPDAVNLDAAATVMTPGARKQTKRAISALKSGKLLDAQRYLDDAHRTAPSDPNLNFLLGYLYFQKKDYSQASTYLGTSTSINPHNAQALTLLGRAGLERSDYPAARSALEQAILADTEGWLPHNLLADAYLHEKNYGRARDEAQVAIAKGKAAAGSAQLVLGQALLNLGDNQEGIQALNLFLQTSPQQPLAGQVKDLITQAGQRSSSSASSGNAAPADSEQAQARLTGVDPLLALPVPPLLVRAWQPPGVDDVKLAMVPDVVCPSAKVVEESGMRVRELVNDVARFAAVEDLFHQALDEYGSPVRTENRKYNYVASISEPQPGFFSVDEFRSDKQAVSGSPDEIASTGFATLALVFHPDMRDNFDLVCEGQGDWHGQAAWLVHFRQRDDRPNRMHSYKVGDQYYSVKLKGRAWISTDTFQIMRIEAEMVSPVPAIQLLSEHQIVEYGPVPFQRQNTTLWLPKSAEIFFDFRKHRYYRRHSFDQYMLFSVDSNEKRKEPAVKPPANPS